MIYWKICEMECWKAFCYQNITVNTKKKDIYAIISWYTFICICIFLILGNWGRANACCKNIHALTTHVLNFHRDLFIHEYWFNIIWYIYLKSLLNCTGVIRSEQDLFLLYFPNGIEFQFLIQTSLQSCKSLSRWQ